MKLRYGGEEVVYRLLERRKVWETMRKLWKANRISRKVKRELYERTVIPTVVFGSETWSLSAQEKIKTEGVGQIRRARVRDGQLREKCGW